MDDERRVLPLKGAYRFGGDHGIEQQVAEIRDMEVEWDLSTSSVRRGHIVALFTQHRLLDAFKEQCWPAGGTPWGNSHCDYCLRLKQRYEDFLAGPRGTPEPDDTEEQAFAAETDLRDFLANNLGCVETGLRLYQDGERAGIEYPIEDGRLSSATRRRTRWLSPVTHHNHVACLRAPTSDH